MGIVVCLLGIIERLVGIGLIRVINIFPYIRIIVGCLRLVQIVLGNHIIGIVILDQGIVFPILLIVHTMIEH